MMTTKKENGNSIFKNLIVIAFLFVSFSVVSAQSADDDFSGNWKTEQGPVVEVTKSGDTYSGKNVEHDKTVLENLKYEDGEWTGTLIQPKDGSSYKCTVVLDGKEMKLKVKKGIMSKTMTWTKE